VIPAVACVAAIVGAEALLRTGALDRLLNEALFSGSIDGARGMLQVIATTTMTVASLVFSLTLLTLQLASSQFSPRLLRTFLRDPVIQIVMATFLATFVYCLTVLRSLPDASEGPVELPTTAITLAYLLALASVAALVLFINRVVAAIRIDTLMRDVHAETNSVVDRVYPVEAAGSNSTAIVTDFSCNSREDARAPEQQIVTTSSGFIQAIGIERIAKSAEEANALVRLLVRPGDRVIAGGVVAVLSGGSGPDDAVPNRHGGLAQVIESEVQIGFERTMQQDTTFGVRQLTDVAIKALSPGVNDPTTAVHAIGHLTGILCVLVTRVLGPRGVADSQGVLRVQVPWANLSEYLDVACGQVRRYGSGEPLVVAALTDLLVQIDSRVERPRDREVIRCEAQRLFDDAERTIENADDRDSCLAPLRQLLG